MLLEPTEHINNTVFQNRLFLMSKPSVLIVTSGLEMRTKPVCNCVGACVVHKLCSHYEVFTVMCNVQEDANLLEYEAM